MGRLAASLSRLRQYPSSQCSMSTGSGPSPPNPALQSSQPHIPVPAAPGSTIRRRARAPSGGQPAAPAPVLVSPPPAMAFYPQAPTATPHSSAHIRPVAIRPVHVAPGGPPPAPQPQPPMIPILCMNIIPVTPPAPFTGERRDWPRFYREAVQYDTELRTNGHLHDGARVRALP